jgi:HSP20 family molecular chaperone IbpA
MERKTYNPVVTIAHDLDGKRLKLDIELPDVDEKNISLDMKKDSFCISAPKNGLEYSGCFLLDHEVEPQKTETKYEDGVFRISTFFKGWQQWDRLREGFMGRPVVKG